MCGQSVIRYLQDLYVCRFPELCYASGNPVLYLEWAWLVYGFGKVRALEVTSFIASAMREPLDKTNKSKGASLTMQ